jgi:TGS domain
MKEDAFKAKLVLYVPFESKYETGFALPVFQSGSSEYLVQRVDELSGKIESFAPVDTVGTNPVRAQSSLEVTSGDYAHYSFVNENGAWHIGTLQHLEPELLRFYRSCPNFVFLNLQIAELVGSKDMRLESRALVYRSVAERAGHAAARAFLTATLRHSLWSSLLGSALNKQAVTGLVRCRRQIMAMVDWEEPDLLPSQLWDTIGPFLNIDRQEIVRQLRSEKSAMDVRSRPGTIKIYTLNDDVPLPMPFGSTPLDVAYRIHTKLGDETVGAVINGKVMPLRTRLEDGDRISILRSEQQHAQPGWLSFVFTLYAYQMIRRNINRRTRREVSLAG